METKDFVSNIADRMISPWKQAEIERSRSIESQAKSLDDDQFEEMLNGINDIVSSVKLEHISISSDDDWNYSVPFYYSGPVTTVYQGVRYIEQSGDRDGEWVESTKLVPLEMDEAVAGDIAKLNANLSEIGIEAYRPDYRDDELERITSERVPGKPLESKFVAHYSGTLNARVIDPVRFEEYCKKFTS